MYLCLSHLWMSMTMDRPESHVFIVDGRSLSTCGQICFFALRCLHEYQSFIAVTQRGGGFVQQ